MSEVSGEYKTTKGDRHIIKNCHNTPKQIIDAVLECFGSAIALDPCSNSHECPNVPLTFHGISESSFREVFRPKAYCQ